MKLKSLLAVLLITIVTQTVSASGVRPRKIKKMLRKSEVLAKHYVGFALYDLKDRKMIAEENSDKYFTPASNTKLYTFYAGLKLLKDSVPGLQYRISGDSLLLWGTGDPTLLHPDFANQSVIQKLQQSGKKLYFVSGRYTGKFYGNGWMYSDYNGEDQPELSELPLYGNIVRFFAQSGTLRSIPEETVLSTSAVLKNDGPAKGFTIQRDFTGNIFHIPTGGLPAKFRQDIPYKVYGGLTDNFLRAKLPNYAGTIPWRQPANTKTWYSFPKDSVFKRMLLPSDNFIAEQLLFTYAAENGLAMNTDSVISYVTKKLLNDLPDKLQWFDGSGLTRYDLFTPRDMVKLCEKIYDEVNNEDRLFDMLPQGGKQGTIKSLYKSEDKPFVFAKTGTLSNNHNLTGYVLTKKGKRLIFSFMNNNYTVPTATIRAEMERIITWIHNNG